MIHGAATSIAKYLFGEVIGDFLYAPVWWYSRGFLGFARSLGNRWLNLERSLGLRLWLRTLGKPMYGQYDIMGKVISFFMRIAVLFFRAVIFLVYTLLLAVAALVWLAAPVFVVWQIVVQFTGLLIA